MKYELIKEYPGSKPKGTVYSTSVKEWEDVGVLVNETYIKGWPEYFRLIVNPEDPSIVALKELREEFHEYDQSEEEWDDFEARILSQYTITRK